MLAQYHRQMLVVLGLARLNIKMGRVEQGAEAAAEILLMAATTMAETDAHYRRAQ